MIGRFLRTTWKRHFPPKLLGGMDMNKNILWIVLIGICQFLVSSNLHAVNRESVGTSASKFLQLGVNARAIAMGEAYSAVSDGSDSIHWNPARLALVEGKSLSLMHSVYLETLFYDYGSYAQKIGSAGTLGVSMQYLSGSQIDRTDALGSGVGTFNPYDLALSAGWAFQFKDLGEGRKILLGISGKFIQSRIIQTATGGAVDAGFSFNLSRKLWFGFAVQNIGPSLKYNDKGDPLPLNVKLGSSYQLLESLLLAADVNSPRDNDLNVSLGAEVKKSIARDMWLAGRTGFNSRTTPDINGLSSISAGVGFGWQNYGVDFAWVPFGGLGHTYRVSLSAKF